MNKRRTKVVAETTSTDIRPAPEAAVADPKDEVLAQVLAELREMRANQTEMELSFAQEREAMSQRLQSAEDTARKAAIAQDMMVEGAHSMTPEVTQLSLRADHPEKNIEVKLDIMSKRAKENGDGFDRERTRKVLMGEPVEDLNRWVFMGHAFDSEVQMEAYKDKVKRELEQDAGRYPRNPRG